MDTSYFSFGAAFTALSQPTMSALSIPECSGISQPEMAPAHHFGVSAAYHIGEIQTLRGPIVEPIFHAGIAKPVLGESDPTRAMFNQPVQSHPVVGTQVDTRS